MNTLTKIVVTTVLSLLMLSCNFDMNLGTGVSGNGNVTTEERTINEDYDAIVVSRGLDVYLTQSESKGLRVQADDNLHGIIMTKVENNVLEIYAEENIKYAESKKVMVSFTSISAIKATSGSDVYSTNTIVADNLKLTTTSGSDMELDIETETADCKSTSGSDLKLSGKTNKLIAVATSGSDLKAKDLIANICDASANSGADITVNTKEKLHATASSGGDIKYYGDPINVNKSDGVSGKIRKQ